MPRILVSVFLTLIASASLAQTQQQAPRPTQEEPKRGVSPSNPVIRPPVSVTPPSRVEPVKPLPSVKPVKGDETKFLRVLLALDTDDQQGITWGRDGDNMRALLETAFQKQGLQGRYQIEMFTGASVSPEHILAYYRNLKPDPDEALLFYYSGHGGTHLSRGHFMALRRGNLYRKDLLDAMAASKPRLRVVLTDCCANLAGGAYAAEPPGATVQVVAQELKPSRPRARTEEPVVAGAVPRGPNKLRDNAPPRPTNTLERFRGQRAQVGEPAAEVHDVKVDAPRNRAVAKKNEPAIAAIGGGGKASLSLVTHDGVVAMRDIFDAADGEVLRHLLFRHAGVVDINGSKRGTFSFGTLEWGGSLFTNTLIVLQKKRLKQLDANGNHLVEWSEFFPHLERGTLDAGQRLPRNRVVQNPEAYDLGAPVMK